MLSYRHVFHAGNHADVLKHSVLLAILAYFNQKDKPYWVVDTHAGAGGYRFDAGRAKSHAAQHDPEYAEGIGRLWSRQDLPPLLADYVAAVRQDNPDGQLRRYPGSPLLTVRMLRPQDRLRLFELHPADVRLLGEAITAVAADARRQVAIRQEDGFTGLQTLLPPPPRRGLIVIDPAYEDKRDYGRVVTALKEGVKRFASGTYLIWYPLLQRNECMLLAGRLKKVAPDWLNVTLTVKAPAPEGLGMHGSGLFIVNPPWTLAATLKETLPWLTDTLATDTGKVGAGWTAEFSAPTPQPPPRRG